MRRHGGGRRNVHQAMLELIETLLDSLGSFYCDFHQTSGKGVEFLTVKHAESLRYMINKMKEESAEYAELEEGDGKKVQVDQIIDGFMRRIGSKAVN